MKSSKNNAVISSHNLFLFVSYKAILLLVNDHELEAQMSIQNYGFILLFFVLGKIKYTHLNNIEEIREFYPQRIL